uniref:Cadherin domain-containing protein n=1 Tax=Acanthochromis polyacanthus TaxID=80966 RepID=A0A3Q1FDF9_9TELE
MGPKRSIWSFLLFMWCLTHIVSGQIRYTIPEELKRGSLIGNVAQDLGLDVHRLRSGRARIVTRQSIQYTELKTDKGILVVNERIDREQLCGDVTPCSFSFEVILENPMELHRITVEITDINDNSPMFRKDEMKFEISESAVVGSRFILPGAEDADVGSNGLQKYILTANDIFGLKQHSNPDGRKYAEMILQKPLDRESEPKISLKLIAVDGGNPHRSGTVNIDITVLDVNDNPPVFNQSVYRATVSENALKGTYITTVNASDADSGSNGLITYRFSNMKEQLADIFYLDEVTGTITLAGQVDYEKDRKYEIMIEAMDQGGLTDSSKVLIEIVDVNDNAPVINVMSFSSPVPEDSPSGTTVAIINVIDADSDQNGQITCTTDSISPFKIKSTLTNYYALITGSSFDREIVPEYNITVRATDSGSPPLSSTTILRLKISDVNDNAPLFDKNNYVAHLIENNSPGMSIFSVKARDMDWNQNARISYFLEDTQINGSPTSSYVSINTETGAIHAVHSLEK